MERLDQRIERFLRTGDGDFNSLAPKLFDYQRERNRPYQAYCRSLGVNTVERWQDIPAVPVSAFKSAELATFPVGQAAAVFESSGTTVKTPSRHYMKTLRYYEASLQSSFAQSVLQMGFGPTDQRDAPLGQTPILILTPSPAEAPRSSLSWMMEVVKRRWGAPGSQYFVRQGLKSRRRANRRSFWGPPSPFSPSLSIAAGPAAGLLCPRAAASWIRGG
jgi:hypothetical protein